MISQSAVPVSDEVTHNTTTSLVHEEYFTQDIRSYCIRWSASDAHEQSRHKKAVETLRYTSPG